MKHKHQNPSVALFNTENFQELPSCGIEDVDRAVFDLFDKTLPLFLEVDGEVRKIPVIYATGERAVLLSKRRPLRDNQGALILPLISVIRTGIEQDPDGYGVSPNTKEIVIKKKIAAANLEYKRSINEHNLDSQDHVLSGSAAGNRFTTRNHKPGVKNTKIRGSHRNIYETYTMPAPRFFQCSYDITFWVHFQQQINSIYESIMSSYMTPARQFLISSDKGYTFTAIFDRAFSPSNNFDDFTDSERLVKSTLSMKVNGYVINPEGPGLMPQIKRYTSSPKVVFDTTLGKPPIPGKKLNVQSGDPAEYIRTHYSHETDPLPGSMTYGFTPGAVEKAIAAQKLLDAHAATAVAQAAAAKAEEEMKRATAAAAAAEQAKAVLKKEEEAKAAAAAISAANAAAKAAEAARAESAARSAAKAAADAAAKFESDILLGNVVKTSGQELLILDEDPITGAKVERKYIIKDAHHRKGETVLREVKIFG